MISFRSMLTGCSEGGLHPGLQLRDAGAEGLGDDGTITVDHDGRVVGVDPIHAADPGQRIAAARDKLGGPVFREQAHHDEHRFGADGEIHRPTDCGNRLRRAGVPVGQVAALGDLERAEHADVEMAAAHHRERIGVMKVRGAGQLGHGDLAGVDQVRIDLLRASGGTHVEHAVLGVQHYA